MLEATAAVEAGEEVAVGVDVGSAVGAAAVGGGWIASSYPAGTAALVSAPGSLRSAGSVRATTTGVESGEAAAVSAGLAVVAVGTTAAFGESPPELATSGAEGRDAASAGGADGVAEATTAKAEISSEAIRPVAAGALPAGTES